MTMMIGELNRRRHEDDQISYFGFTLPKVVRILREYQVTCPTGQRRLYYFVCGGCVVAGMIVVAGCVSTID
jgi:hypothetical protein